MRLLLRAILLAAIVAAAPAARAQLFIADLAGPNESPPNASPGTGFAEVTLLGDTMHVQVTFSGLTAPSTASHIHATTALPFTGTAGVATAVPTFPGFPLGVTAGTYDQTFDMTLASSYNPAFVTANGGSVSASETALFSAIETGHAYLNVHTTNFPAGEIRGFLVLATPEPGPLALLAGITACGALLRFSRRRRAA